MEEPLSSSATSDDRSLKTAESLRALRDQADQTLSDHRQRVNETETRIYEQLQLVADELARERLADKESDEKSAAASDEQTAILEQLHQTLTEKEVEVERIFDQLAAQSLEFESQITERDDELEQVLQLCEEEGQQRESLQEELDSARQALENLRAKECDVCAQKNMELTDAGEQLNQLSNQISELQENRESQQAELDVSRQVLQSAQDQNEQVVASLTDAEQKIEELTKLQQDAEENAEQQEQTRRKFELALADVHKLKRENAELHEELLSRPVANDQESPELISLRAERDALAERVVELESVPTSTSAADGQQELEDLQRRFELAVDDVRQLKQENTDLQQQLASASAATSTRSSDDSQEEPQDWQAQKARLMATLEAEEQGDVGINEPRRKDRATIEGTISITDRVVAEKDAVLARREAQLEELRAQLEARPEGQDLEELREQIAAEILGDDEAVQSEVGRLQQQQQELDAKLREAELEISVQRATLARERSALEEKLAQLPYENAEDQASSAGKPRRRWLSALGLKDDDEDES